MESSIKLRKVSIPFREPFRISSGTVTDRESVIVEVLRGGHSGFGEASPLSGAAYSAETPESSWAALEKWLAPLWLSSEFSHPSEVSPLLDEIPGEAFAKAAIESASWDLDAQQGGRPLYELLGSQSRPIESGVAIGIFDTIEELLERVRVYSEQGYRRVKIKIQPGWDIDVVQAVRERFGSIPLMVDANAAYGIGDLAVFEQLDRFNLMMFEQPFPGEALEEMAELQRKVSTPVCADESAESLSALEKIIELGSARIINIKVQRVGGLGPALAMYRKAHEKGLGIWLGTMPELGIASVQGLHLATLPGFGYPTDVEASLRWYDDDLVEPLIAIDRNGLIRIPEGPGMGYRVDREKLESATVQELDFKV